MSKINTNYILIITLLIFIVFCGGILGCFLNKKSPVLISEKKYSKIKKEEIIPVAPEEVWKTYTNSELGFSIKYPEMVYGVNRCSSEKPFYVPLKVFEDNENDMVFITQEYYYDNWDSELQNNTGPCEKITYSLKSLREDMAPISEYITSPKPWLGIAIIIKDINSDIKLDKFIKNTYGSGCFANNKKLLGENGVYEIEIKGEDWDKGADLGTTACIWNYIYKILYSPEKNKLMSVNLGQECQFGTMYVSEESYKCYDEKMVNSFWFE